MYNEPVDSVYIQRSQPSNPLTTASRLLIDCDIFVNASEPLTDSNVLTLASNDSINSNLYFKLFTLSTAEEYLTNEPKDVKSKFYFTQPNEPLIYLSIICCDVDKFVSNKSFQLFKSVPWDFP